jgi:hypothetical protein
MNTTTNRSSQNLDQEMIHGGEDGMPPVRLVRLLQAKRLFPPRTKREQGNLGTRKRFRSRQIEFWLKQARSG